MELSGYFALLMAPVLLSLLGLLMRQVMTKGDLAPNSALGLRTKATMSSDRAWKAGHAAADPYFLAMAFVGAAATVTSLVLPFAVGDDDGLYPAGIMLAPGLGLVIQVVVLLKATSAANTAAKAL